MSEQVAVRDVDVYLLTVFHEIGDDGRAACRHGQKSDTTFRVESREDLPEGVTKCNYCKGDYTPATSYRPGTATHMLANADPEEVLADD